MLMAVLMALTIGQEPPPRPRGHIAIEVEFEALDRVADQPRIAKVLLYCRRSGSQLRDCSVAHEDVPGVGLGEMALAQAAETRFTPALGSRILGSGASSGDVYHISDPRYFSRAPQ